jgi:hypothetical protein
MKWCLLRPFALNLKASSCRQLFALRAALRVSSFCCGRNDGGRGATLKEQTIAIALYPTRRDSNGGGDSIVRADARRVRDKLREYYAESPTGPVVIGPSEPRSLKRSTVDGVGGKVILMLSATECGASPSAVLSSCRATRIPRRSTSTEQVSNQLSGASGFTGSRRNLLRGCGNFTPGELRPWPAFVPATEIPSLVPADRDGSAPASDYSEARCRWPAIPCLDGAP